jgi:hypothetical protein
MGELISGQGVAYPRVETKSGGGGMQSFNPPGSQIQIRWTIRRALARIGEF